MMPISYSFDNKSIKLVNRINGNQKCPCNIYIVHIWNKLYAESRSYFENKISTFCKHNESESSAKIFQSTWHDYIWILQLS